MPKTSAAPICGAPERCWPMSTPHSARSVSIWTRPVDALECDALWNELAAPDEDRAVALRPAAGSSPGWRCIPNCNSPSLRSRDHSADAGGELSNGRPQARSSG